jgi:16S rRNA (cytosine1402-N4)-methyltransferase
MVKEFFNSLVKACVCPSLSPVCVCGKKSLAKLLTKGVVTASEDEMLENTRSRSAKLRAIEKI